MPKVLLKRKRSLVENTLQIYCRRCMKTKPASSFFSATDTFLDKNGYFSICKDCCGEIYEIMLESEGSMARAILRCCRMFNVNFNESAIAATEKHIETVQKRNGKIGNHFGVYKTKLQGMSKGGDTTKENTWVLTFSEPTKILPPSDPIDAGAKNAKELVQFWGENLNKQDYIWLEENYAKWKSEYSIRTSGEAELLKMIILKLFDIRKSRQEGQSTDKLEVAFQNDLFLLSKTFGIIKYHLLIYLKI